MWIISGGCVYNFEFAVVCYNISKVRPLRQNRPTLISLNLMRRFTSYGPVDPKIHYYVPRTELIDQICSELVGDNPEQGGRYITIWAPRQAGKSWATNQTVHTMREAHPEFDVVKQSIQELSRAPMERIFKRITQNLSEDLNRDLPVPTTQDEFVKIFSNNVLQKPLILILDEFDALSPDALEVLIGAFRNIYNVRYQDTAHKTEEKKFLLHGLALIGVRSVLGVDNLSGSPFNIQRSIRIPDLTDNEVHEMFNWYERESGQPLEAGVVDRIMYEVRGQPGLTSWLGEILTETHNAHGPTITMDDFERSYSEALNALPNANVLNLISKVEDPKHKLLVFDLFNTNTKIPFKYDDPSTTNLYLNGVIERETNASHQHFIKFSSPFIQKRLFNYFATEMYGRLGRLYDPFDNLENTVTNEAVDIPNLMQRYEQWLQKNRTRLLKDAPRRRTDDRLYEAVYHFNLYMYLSQFMTTFGGYVYPEFPTGNGKIDLLIKYADQTYGLEVKSFLNAIEYQKSLVQAADYAQQLGLTEIWLIMFVEAVNDENRQRYQIDYTDSATSVTVKPLFVVTG